MRTAFAIALAALLSLGVPTATGARSSASRAPRAERVSAAGLQGGPAAFREAVFQGGLSAFPAARAAWGGPTTAATGETVNVLVSAAYAVDPAIPQGVADFLAQLYHGAELATVTVYVAPLPEVQSLCGPEAGGCYSSVRRIIVAPGEDLPSGTSTETVLAHEYGHHVAASRDNAPWVAVDWGTKRWATRADVCRRATEGTAFPGDEGERYFLNPGEAFAEAYRFLNYQKATWPSWPLTPWSSDPSFFPDQAALDAVREDVLDPWTGPTESVWRGRLVKPPGKKATAKTQSKKKAKPVAPRPYRFALPTPLDGQLALQLRAAPAGATVSVADLAGRQLVSPQSAPVSTTVCGERALVVTVRAKKPGSVAAVVSAP